MIQIKITDDKGVEKFSTKGNSIDVVYKGEYNAGDKIIISKTDTEYLSLKLDETLAESIVFAPISTFEFPVPYGELKKGYDNKSFVGDSHRIRVYEPDDEVKYGSRKISLNSHDIRGQRKYFPHAYANLVTREAPCFFERNAIDGIIENHEHGDYPYHSWAGGAREDLEYYIDFGTPVEVEKVVFFLRADFPHDTYWKSLDVEFDDKTRITANFTKTADSQEILLPEKKTTRIIHLTNFKQAELPFSWAALSQIEVYGNYIKEDLSKMEIRNASNPRDVKNYDTDRLREEFHISKLFTKDNMQHIDRNTLKAVGQTVLEVVYNEE